jgi:plasmid stabilization system protein ParE
MNFSFHPLARADLIRAVEYSKECEPDLGVAFMEEVRAAVLRLTLAPRAWSAFTVNTRRCRTKRFPFSIVYRLRDDHLEIVAVANSRRRPDYWTGRLNECPATYGTREPGVTASMTPPSRNVESLP